jgi:hypothetical protein
MSELFNKVDQFEVMAAIRAYAKQIAEMGPLDQRPSTALHDYREKIARMSELSKKLKVQS